MKHASLFSGIGGPEIAAAMMGWENAFHCEINPFGRAILNYWFPNSVSYEDITKTDFRKWRGQIDVLTGGFPCQPFSYAGKRKGKNDERYLWPEMLRAIDEIRPAWVVGENVGGIATMVENGVFTELGCDTDLFGAGNDIYRYELQESYTLERICKDLEAIQYETQPFLIPACAVNAPHRRDRIFIVAHNTNCCNDEGNAGKDAGTCATQGVQERDEIRIVGKSNNVRSEISRDSSDAVSGGSKPRKTRGRIETGGRDAIPFKEERGNTTKRNNVLSTIPRNVANATSNGRDGRTVNNGEERRTDTNGKRVTSESANGIGFRGKFGIYGKEQSFTDATGKMRNGRGAQVGQKRKKNSNDEKCAVQSTIDGFSEKRIIADADFAGLQRNGRAELQRNEGREDTEKYLAGDSGMLPENRWKYNEHGEWVPTVPPVHGRNDGLPFPVDNLTISFGKWRTESLKAYGNAIVPQVMFRIFQAIEFASKEK